MSSILSKNLYTYCAVLLAVTSSVLVSCDNTVEPFGETSAKFGLFGFLDAAADTQFVRVEIRRESQSRVGLEVPKMISRNLESGLQQTWQDSLVTLETGDQGLLFWSAFRPEESSRYQLEVSDPVSDLSSGGTSEMSSAIVEMPSSPVMSINPTVVTNAATWEQQLIFEETPAIPDRVSVRYVTAYRNGALYVNEVDYFTRFVTYDVNAWSMRTRLSRDLDSIRGEGGFGDTEEIRFKEAKVILRLRSEQWLNGGSTNSNVENGFGFVGSVITFEEIWPIDADVLLDRNFRNEQ